MENYKSCLSLLMDDPGDEENYSLKIEAEEVVKEVKFAVENVETSQILPKSDQMVYMNIQTKEGNIYCVELSVQGFRVVGRQYDTIDDSKKSQYYETIYALLDKVSPEYRNSFGEALLQKLQGLQKQEEMQPS
ncbi:hypothetical protein FSP39_011894 [Pinctada imbricata]|uniref:GSKIP domain-containing protein n=1 Tax=Pinctada imbricata TaxID=66713 RepID=A0AA89BVH0_PINIB|nr:hypothetical protein FSP39_011894 [Pinctada imbricata]